jgi:hypothetical protein
VEIIGPKLACRGRTIGPQERVDKETTVDHPTLFKIMQILIGMALLSMGRRLFWLFVGAAGFIVGSSLGTHLLMGEPAWVVILLSLVLGMLGAILAVIAQGVAVGIAGFVLGGYGAAALLAALHLGGASWAWLATAGGGIVGVLLVILLLDPALIGLSSLAGASLAVRPLHLSPSAGSALFVVLVIFGAVIQSKATRRKDRRKGNRDTRV